MYIYCILFILYYLYILFIIYITLFQLYDFCMSPLCVHSSLLQGRKLKTFYNFLNLKQYPLQQTWYNEHSSIKTFKIWRATPTQLAHVFFRVNMHTHKQQFVEKHLKQKLKHSLVFTCSCASNRISYYLN